MEILIAISILVFFVLGIFCGFVIVKHFDRTSAMAAMLIRELETYDFDCMAGPLTNCLPFMRLKNLFK
jgi:hypothetical protein